MLQNNAVALQYFWTYSLAKENKSRPHFWYCQQGRIYICRTTGVWDLCLSTHEGCCAEEMLPCPLCLGKCIAWLCGWQWWLVSKLASLHHDAIYPKLIATLAPHDKAWLNSMENKLKAVYFVSLEEEMTTFNESFQFSKLFFLFKLSLWA